MRLGRHLVVEAEKRLLIRVNIRDVLIELRIRRREDERLRLALVVVAEEIVQLVLPERPAEGSAQLLILVREYPPGDRIGRVQLVVAEISREGAGGDDR